MKLDLKLLAEHIRQSETEDLLDRYTIFDADMEPVALDLIGNELSRRRVSSQEIAEHLQKRTSECVWMDTNEVFRCSYCGRPAVYRGWGWHKLWNKLPIFPRVLSRCVMHQPPDSMGTLEDPTN